jgi:glycosyltransferase involved in cell wall biosynthesis
MRDEPTFSVLIPAYDVEAFIEPCLDSVAAQTWRDYEIVVVDDGSRDATRARVDGWCRRHPAELVSVLTQANGGIGHARNAALAQARGTFVAFLDSDDWWLEEKLARVAAVFDGRPELDLVCHDEWLVEPDGRKRRLRHGPHTRYEALLLDGNSVSTSATVVRRRLLDKVGGFSEDLRFNGAEDYDLWLRLAEAGGRFAYLHDILGAYREHPAGITGRAEQQCRNMLNVLEAHFSRLPSPSWRQRYRMRRLRAATMRGAVRTLMKQDRRAAAWRMLAAAALEHPLSWKTWALATMNLAGVTR